MACLLCCEMNSCCKSRGSGRFVSLQHPLGIDEDVVHKKQTAEQVQKDEGGNYDKHAVLERLLQKLHGAISRQLGNNQIIIYRTTLELDVILKFEVNMFRTGRKCLICGALFDGRLGTKERWTTSQFRLKTKPLMASKWMAFQNGKENALCLNNVTA